MQQVFKDTAGLGIFFWLVGFLAGMLLFFTPFRDSMGWIITAVFTPFTILVTWWWFKGRDYESLEYYAGVGIAWALAAAVLDYVFIVKLLGSTTYYAPHIFVYYALMFLIPVAVGIFLNRNVVVIHTG